MTEKRLGKIQSIKIGDGGYQDAMFGVSFTLGGSGWGVGDFWGTWGIERSDYCKWTEQDRQAEIAKTFWRLKTIMDDAKVHNANDLKDVPVEVTFDGNTLKEWRILTEVV